jgi:hypothetical protein
LKDIREVSWHDQEGKKQQKKAGSRYRLIATGDTTTAKRFRTLTAPRKRFHLEKTADNRLPRISQLLVERCTTHKNLSKE